MKKSFTLAEVLITLAVIGIVASLTIPIVIRNYQERQTVTSLKKFYSNINQAFYMAKAEKGNIENLPNPSYDHKTLAYYFKPYLKIVKECSGTNSDCAYNGNYITVNGMVNACPSNPNSGDYYRMVLADGTTIWIRRYNSTCQQQYGINNFQYQCGIIGVDINGVKGPNKLGVDTFYFSILKSGVYPMGLPDNTWITLSDHCRTGTWWSDQNGYACTAWVIVKGNMDYLRRSVSW